MATAFSGKIKRGWKASDTLIRLIIINAALYLGLLLTKAICRLFMINLEDYFKATDWLAVPASLSVLMTKPWTLLTYMFFHEEFFHIAFNMLWLYWMGKIFQEYMGNKKLVSTYIIGGLSGAVLFILAYNIFPLFRGSVQAATALGASAGVLAVTVGAATKVPEYRVALFGILVVPLKYIAIFTFLFDFVNISGNNAGGHIAHIGGAIYGFLYVRGLNRGKDYARWFNSVVGFLAVLFRGGSRMRVTYKRPVQDEEFLNKKKALQERVDEILDKISKSGYGSLSKEEKDFLFKSSKEN